MTSGLCRWPPTPRRRVKEAKQDEGGVCVLVLLSFLLNVADLLGYLLESVLVVGVGGLEIYSLGFGVRKDRGGMGWMSSGGETDPAASWQEPEPKT